MLAVDRPLSAKQSGPEGRTRAQLRLRADGRLFELPAGKTTVGSSPRCSLRIEQPGVQPVHCLIVRGPEGLSVRRWAADTRLNGAAFDEAPLLPGDCLRLGSVELELVHDLARESEAEESTAPVFADDEQTLEQVQPVATQVEPRFESTKWAADEAVDVCDRLIEAAEDDVDGWRALTAPSADSQERGTVDFVAAPVGEPEFAAVAEEWSNVQPSADGPSTDYWTSLEQVADSADFVFQELQSACGIARGRSRKLLSSLRDEREQNRELLKQLMEAAEQIVALRIQSPESADESAVKAELREWEQQVRQLQGQIAGLETMLADNMRQMIELQQELSETRVARVAVRSEWLAKVVSSAPIGAGEPVESATADGAVTDLDADPLAWPEKDSADVEPTTLDAVSGSKFAQSATEPAAINWSSPRNEPTTGWELPSASGDVVRTASEAKLDPWGGPAAQSSDWRGAMAPADPGEEPIVRAPAWVGTARLPAETDDDDVFGTPAKGDQQADAAGWLGEERKPLQIEREEEDSPFGGLSAWEQRASRDEAGRSGLAPGAGNAGPGSSSNWETTAFAGKSPTMRDEEVAVKPMTETSAANQLGQAAVEPAEEAVADAKPKVQPTSFIEKYSHLFAEDAVSEASPTMVPQKPAADTPTIEKPSSVGIVRNEVSPAAAQGDEESIEQYMAKLLQRVRGDSPNKVAASMGPPTVSGQEKAAVPTAADDAPAPPAEPVIEQPQTEEEMAEAAVNWDALARKAVAASPTTDIGALRALANETARRAIGQHQLKTYRRHAVTKVIVSMLAGVTSLWLMLEAPSWKDLQFITACVSLVVAAYWAGEAFRAMLESWRAAAYERPAVVGERGLPIDVE